MTTIRDPSIPRATLGRPEFDDQQLFIFPPGFPHIVYLLHIVLISLSSLVFISFASQICCCSIENVWDRVDIDSLDQLMRALYKSFMLQTVAIRCATLFAFLTNRSFCFRTAKMHLDININLRQ